MADEFEILPNPDGTPGAVSTGYQRQNTNSEISRNGLDLSSVTIGPGADEITIDISGGVDVNGVMYSCKTSVVLAVPVGTRYIKLTAGATVNTLTPVLQSGNGLFDKSKNARYDSGERILNWIIDYDGLNVYIKRWLNVNELDVEANRFHGDLFGDLIRNKAGNDNAQYVVVPASTEVNSGMLRNNKIVYAKRFSGTLSVQQVGSFWAYKWTVLLSIPSGITNIIKGDGFIQDAAGNINILFNSVTDNDASGIEYNSFTNTLILNVMSTVAGRYTNSAYDIILYYIK
jgi:hypothetical protein